MRIAIAIVTVAAVCGIATALYTRPSDVSTSPVLDGPDATEGESRDDAGHDDLDAVIVLAASANRLQQTIAVSAPLFSRSKEQPLSADERELALQIFADVLDHCYAFDSIAAHHLGVWKRRPVGRRETAARHFDTGFLAYLEKLALALALVDVTINKPQFEKLFDEGDVRTGLPPGAYAKLKWNVVHVEDAGKTLAAYGFLKLLTPKNNRHVERDERYRYVLSRIEERYARVKTTLVTRAPQLFGGNTIDIGVDVAHAAWFPVQATAAEWMGDTRVRRQGRALISEAQVKEAIGKSEPGDIIVERRNWYLSNIGLPGFWPHAALFVGSAAELQAWSKDKDVDAAFGGSLVEHLKKTYPKAWASFAAPAHDGGPHRIIEAISEGVVANAAEESLRADYVAAMRPRLSKLEKAKAIERAFSYMGRPYDFDFDFDTDGSLVCSELVFKSYEPREGQKGVVLGLEKVVGRMTLGPNSIVRTFDQALDGPNAQLNFAWFLDGREREGTASFSDVAAFRASWKRPKWDIVQQ